MHLEEEVARAFRGNRPFGAAELNGRTVAIVAKLLLAV